MKLPRAEEVQIDARKVRGYLLSQSHPVGRFKARVLAAVGFDDTKTGVHCRAPAHCGCW